MKVLSVSHVPFEGLGSLSGLLKDRGAVIEQIVSYQNDIGIYAPEEHDLAIILGGPMGVYQADIFPFLNAEMRYIEKRLEKGLPTLGICLGSQLMAKVLGSNVYPGKQGKEIGWYKLDVSEAGSKTPLRHLDGEKTMMMHWHGDTYDFPKDATLLARSDKYAIQAYSYGKNALAVQCHPEVTRDSLEFWIVSGGFAGLEKEGISVQDFRKQTEEHVDRLNRQTALFFNEWIEKVMVSDRLEAGA